MKIIVVHNHYRIRGGEDSVFEAECAMLEGAGHTVVRYEKSNADIRENGPLRKAALFLKTIWNWRTYRDMRALIRKEKPDAVHCHNTFPLVSPSVYWAASREGVPVVQTLHNYRFACLGGYLFRNGRVCEECLGRAPWRGIRHRCYRSSLSASATLAATLLFHRILGTYRRKVSCYIALTPFTRDKFVAAGLPADKIVVKPNAFTPPSDLPTNLPRANPPGVAYVGRLSPEKGVDVLVEAWGLLFGATAPAFGDWTLFIIGSGPEEESLRARVESLGVSGRVRFLGALPREEALKALANASALVFPSLWYETFGLTIIEAARLGVPTIVTGIGGQSSLVTDGVTGRLVPPGDPSALADALRELLSDPAALKRMGGAARAAFEASDCVSSRNLARLLGIYSSCHSRRR